MVVRRFAWFVGSPAFAPRAKWMRGASARSRRSLLALSASVGGLVLLGFAGSAAAQINMPDPSVINGKALPAGDLQTGTITVRVTRENVGNVLVGQSVTVTVNGEMKKA